METAKDIMDHFISRAKNLQEFLVETDAPDQLRFNGEIPFDIQIKDSIITAKVWAVDFDEAAKRLDDFLGTCK